MTTFADQLRLVTRAFDPEQTLPRFLDHALRITNAAGGAIYLNRDGPNQPYIEAGSFTGPYAVRVPLMTGSDEIGWLVLSTTDEAPLAADDRDLLQEVANLVAEAVSLAARTGNAAGTPRSARLTV